MPRAMATSKLPRPVSMTVAVVSTREYPLMLPPTMMEAPTSEITPPNPAMTAASRGSRASLIRSQTICMRVAPRARIWSLSLRGKLLDRGHGDTHHNGRGYDRLGNNHGCRRIEKSENTERSVPPQEDGDKKAYDHRRQAHPRIDETHDNSFPRKSGKGNGDPDEDTDQ